MKYFKSLFKQEESQSAEEQIEDLVNELILKLKADGKSIGDESIDKGFGSMSIFVHNLDTEDAVISLKRMGDWELRVKPHFNNF